MPHIRATFPGRQSLRTPTKNAPLLLTQRGAIDSLPKEITMNPTTPDFHPDPATLQWMHDLLKDYEYEHIPESATARARHIIREIAGMHGIEVTA